MRGSLETRSVALLIALLLCCASRLSAAEAAPSEQAIEATRTTPFELQAGRPTTSARHTIGLPGGFDARQARWAAAPARFRSAPLASSGATLFTVTTWARVHDEVRKVIVRDNAEYLLPQGLNAFLVESGVAADGPSQEEIAQLVVRAIRPERDLGPLAVQQIDLVDDGNRYQLRVRSAEFEWELSYGAGPLAGQVRLVNEFVLRGRQRVQLRSLAPEQVTARAITLGLDVTTDARYPGETYLRVAYNSVPTTNTVRFALSGFLTAGVPATGVYLRCRSSVVAYGPLFFTPVPVAIDGAGAGSCTWTPGAGVLTGCSIIELGTVTDPLNPAATFTVNGAWPNTKLTVEKVRAIKYAAPATDSCLVHYCEQFFQNHALGIGHTETFVDYVVGGLEDSWNNQVVSWALAQGHPVNIPVDADQVHHLYVDDHTQDYRGTTTGGLGSAAYASETSRETWIRNDGFYADFSGTAYAAPLYADEDVRTRIAVAHEFFHGVQAGWVNVLGNDGGNWAVEGQARFIPTVQYEAEEFRENTQHLYPLDANAFLGGEYDTELSAQSYRGASYWRFLYENNRPGGTTAQKLGFLNQVLRRFPGSAGLYYTLYPTVVTAGLLADGGAITNFYASRDSFMHTMWRHEWTPNSASILRPRVTGDPDGDRTSLTWRGSPLSADDGITAHHGYDFWKFRLDPDSSLKRLKLSFDADPDRNGSSGQYHLSVMLFKGASNSARVAVLPHALASWDSTFEVSNVDSVAVGVMRVDPFAVATDTTYRLSLWPPLMTDYASYDDIGGVLGALGPRYRHVVVDETGVASATFPWRRYDVIFLNCSPGAAVVASQAIVQDSLRAFVKRGGYLYVSDYDYDYITATWPGAIHFAARPKCGIQGTITGTVTDPGLEAVLGSNSASVTYDLSAWVSVVSPGEGTTVHMLGTYQFDPYAPEAPGVPAKAANISHGDAHGSGALAPDARAGAHAGATGPQRASADFPTRTGPLLLSFPDEKGRVIYTTFHNVAQVGPAHLKLLKYMIFRQVAGDLLARALEELTAGYHAYMQVTNGIAPGQTQDFTLHNRIATAIDVILNWGGSELKLTAKRPNGTVAGTIQGTGPPVMLHIPAADAGDWTFEVEAVDVPDSNYAFALVVGGEAAAPGEPALPALAEALLCEGTARPVTIAVQNLALYPDSFHATFASDHGWTIEPADTVIHAWEGMVDSMVVRVTPPPGTPAFALDSLRSTLTSLTTPANSASGVRAVRLTPDRPAIPPESPGSACPGSVAGRAWLVTNFAPCPTSFVARLTSAHGWSVMPDSIVLEVPGDDFGAVSFGVSVPPGAPDGTVDVLTLRVWNANYASLRDSLSDTLRVAFAPPEALAPAPLQSLRGLNLALACGVFNHAACPKPFSITVRDSLGWSLLPDSVAGFVYPGPATLPVTLHVPSTAPYGTVDRVRVVVRALTASLPPDTAVTYVTVTTPGDVLLVDLGGGSYGPSCASALDGLGRTHTDWYTYYTAPSDTVLAQFQRVIWVGGVGYGFGGADSAQVGRFLRGGGRVLMSAQDFLLDAGQAQPFAAEYFGVQQASEGLANPNVAGRTGSFLASIGTTPIWGSGGAWDQYSPDELLETGGGFAVMDYVSGPAPAVPALALPPSLLDPQPGAARALRGVALHATLPVGAQAAPGLGIAGVANQNGMWRTVFLGFGLEALDDSLVRRAVIEKALHFLDQGTTAVSGSPPGALRLAVLPNPANGAVRFSLTLPNAGQMRLALYDLSGRVVRVLHEGATAAGSRTLTWDGRGEQGRLLASGVYFARLESADGTLTARTVRLGR